MSRIGFRRSCIKSASWGGVSFFLIFAAEALVIVWRDGVLVLGMVGSAVAIGVAISCIVKSPFHVIHDHAWDRLFRQADDRRMRRLIEQAAVNGPTPVHVEPPQSRAHAAVAAYHAEHGGAYVHDEMARPGA